MMYVYHHTSYAWQLKHAQTTHRGGCGGGEGGLAQGKAFKIIILTKAIPHIVSNREYLP